MIAVCPFGNGIKMEKSMRLTRPKINIGAKTLISFTLVFWIPVIALTIGLYHSFSESMFKEELKTVKTNLRGARVVYEERTKVLQSTLKHIANMPAIKTIFSQKHKFDIEQFLINIGKENSHVELLMAVDENQKVLGRRNGRISDIILLGDALSRALMTGETISTTELISHDMVSREDETLATRIKDIGIGQFVIAPVRSEDKIEGAIIAGIVLTGESWLGNSIYEQFGAELALFAGETFESFYLHTTTSLPHATWVIGQKMPDLLSDQISLGKSYYGVPEINGERHIVAFEPIMDSRLRVIGAIGVSKETYDTTILVHESISRILMYVAPAALLLALIITFIIYLDITRPVNFIVNAMKTFEKGSKDISIDIKTGDEFEQLGKGFNNMAKSVVKREERIKKHYDNFKMINDTYGHDRGDEVLKKMGRLLKHMAQKEDVSARYGGDEFVTLYSNMGSTDAAKKAEAIRNAMIQSNFPWTDTEISVSIGVATFPEIKVNSAEELIQKADKAMYEAKSGGQDRVVVYTI